MEELLNETEMKSTKKETEPLAKFPPYTSESYINDILELFYDENISKRKIFELFKVIDERSMEENADIDFIKEIKPYNLNIVERFALIQIAISQIKNDHMHKNEFISKLISLKVAKPLIIINLFNRDSKLAKNNCISFDSYPLTLNRNLFNLLLNSKEKTNNVCNSKKKEQTIDINPNELYCELNNYVIGQDSAIKNIVAGVYEHIIKCQINKDKNKKDKLDKTNTLIIGPTGTGKTFICNTLSKLLDVPIYIADASQFTESGYVGLSADSIILNLAKKCNLQQERKLPVSIIYIDEIDKIAITKENEKNSVGNKGVQEELLKILESSKYLCDGGRFSPEREYDISNVMFILGGAFSGLEQIITTRLNKNKEKKIGFNVEQNIDSNNTDILQQVTTEDLTEYGFMPEFLGRLTNKAILKSLTKKDLINILTTGKNNIIEQYKEIFLKAGITLNIPDETIEFIAEKAIETKTGARGLRNTLSNVLNKILFDASIDKRTDYTLTTKVFCC